MQLNWIWGWDEWLRNFSIPSSYSCTCLQRASYKSWKLHLNACQCHRKDAVIVLKHLLLSKHLTHVSLLEGGTLVSLQHTQLFSALMKRENYSERCFVIHKIHRNNKRRYGRWKVTSMCVCVWVCQCGFLWKIEESDWRVNSAWHSSLNCATKHTITKRQKN